MESEDFEFTEDMCYTHYINEFINEVRETIIKLFEVNSQPIVGEGVPAKEVK